MFDTPELNHLCHGDEDLLDDLMMSANAFGSFLLKQQGFRSDMRQVVFPSGLAHRSGRGVACNMTGLRSASA